MIPHNRPTLGPQEQAAASRVLQSGWVAQGGEVEAFENELCEFFGLAAGCAVVVSSGSSALFLALWALGARGKRVGVPVYSCAALRNAVGMVGAHPVYLDSGADIPNVEPSVAANASLDILIAPSIFGLPVEVDQARNYLLIEDLAQAFGAMVDGSPAGLRGELGVCSFYATKLFTSGGQGGAVISRHPDLIEMIRDYRQFDCRDDARLRFNFQLTDLQAAVGRAQLSRLPEMLKKRSDLFDFYRSRGLRLLDSRGAGLNAVRYRAVMPAREPNALMTALENQSVRAIIPVGESELLDDPARHPNARRFARGLLSLPLYPDLSFEQASRVVDALENSGRLALQHDGGDCQ